MTSDVVISDTAVAEVGTAEVGTAEVDADVFARLVLSRLCEPADVRIGHAVAVHSAHKVLAALRRGSLPAGIERGEFPTIRDVEQALRLADDEIRIAGRTGVDFIAPGSAQWPTQLDDLGNRAPLVLRVKGAINMRVAASHSVAIVGARACTRYGVSVADSIAAHLAGNGWCVISGGAFGIDAAAHLGALAVGGCSIGISAGGADLALPRAHELLYARLRESGAIISEVPLGTHPTKSRFLVRNRLIAALARGVVVVEAAARSGARSTAREAQDIGRVVAAVPGPVTSAASVSCHQLIRDGGAVLVTNGDEVEELIRPIGGYPIGANYQATLL